MFGIFKKKTVQADSPIATGLQPSKKRRLNEIVERKPLTDLGAFEDLNRDLGSFIEENFQTCDPLQKMAYAYARRTAVAGLFFQGIVGANVVKHVQNIFEGLQALTGQTVVFQREAALQATEIVESYVPGLNSEHQVVLLNYAREDITALQLASNGAFNFEIDELEEDPVSIDTCIALINRVFEVSKALGLSLRPAVDLNRQKRLIDIVEKTNQAKLGAFASMCEDVRSSAQSYRGDNILFSSAGYALILGSCGAYVAGGVHPKMISDYSEIAKTLMADIGSDPEAHQTCKEQAIALASTYVHKLTPQAAEIIIAMGLKLDVLTNDGESRLTPDEVVLRAKRIARARIA